MIIYLIADGKVGLPGRSALQIVGGDDVVHQVPVKVHEHSVPIGVCGKELRVHRIDVAVAPKIEVLLVLIGGHAKVLALCLGTPMDTATDSALQFV